MRATSTHDTKRSEDVRARLSVLSEMSTPWREAVRRWSRINRSRKREVEGRQAPSRNDEYHFYQTLVGTWPLTEPDTAGGPPPPRPHPRLMHHAARRRGAARP